MSLALAADPSQPADDSVPPAPVDPSMAVIQDALDGRNTPPPTEAILGGIVEIIKGRGSVIDGSVLDERTPATADDQTPVPIPGTGGGPLKYDWTPETAAGPASLNQEAAFRVETAELLLDVARRLEFVSDGTSTDQPLIRLLRRRAGQLLLQ